MDEKEFESSGHNQLIKKIKEFVDKQEEDKFCVFDKISDSTQEKIYNGAVKVMVEDVFKGHNGAIVALGQTSVKTHVLEGDRTVPAKHGIIQRIVYDIFNLIYATCDNIDFLVKVSYFEIYRDKIRDLLDERATNMPIIEDKNGIPFVRATERLVCSPDELLQVFEDGKSKRHFAETNKGENVARSHTILLIDVKESDPAHKKEHRGKLYIVDLAGNEKVDKSGAEGVMLDETKSINKSLSALLHVISVIASGISNHIPYRDSKLTRILQDSLNGNSKTSFLICNHPRCLNKSNPDLSRRLKKVDVADTEELVMWKKRWKKEKENTSQLKIQISQAEETIKKNRLHYDKQLQEMKDLNERMSKINTVVSKHCKNCDQSQQEILRLKQENNIVKEEVKEVLDALEELAINYNSKVEEIHKQSLEFMKLHEDHNEQLSQLNSTKRESDRLKNKLINQEKQMTDLMKELQTDLSELGITSETATNTIDSMNENESLEYTFFAVKLCTSKLVSKVKELSCKCDHLEGTLLSKRENSENYEKLITDLKQFTFQSEATEKNLRETIIKTENEKNELQKQVQALTEECIKLQLESKKSAEMQKQYDAVMKYNSILKMENDMLLGASNVSMKEQANAKEDNLNQIQAVEINAEGTVSKTIKPGKEKNREDFCDVYQSNSEATEKDLREKIIKTENEKSEMQKQVPALTEECIKLQLESKKSAEIQKQSDAVMKHNSILKMENDTLLGVSNVSLKEQANAKGYNLNQIQAVEMNAEGTVSKTIKPRKEKNREDFSDVYQSNIQMRKSSIGNDSTSDFGMPDPEERIALLKSTLHKLANAHTKVLEEDAHLRNGLSK